MRVNLEVQSKFSPAISPERVSNHLFLRLSRLEGTTEHGFGDYAYELLAIANVTAGVEHTA